MSTDPMIYVTRLNHSELVLNSDLIEHIEATPDTVITLTTGQRITVLETPLQIVSAVRDWRHSIQATTHLTDETHPGTFARIGGQHNG